MRKRGKEEKRNEKKRDGFMRPGITLGQNGYFDRLSLFTSFSPPALRRAEDARRGRV